ncbi:hypothetical protein L207DRAFT_508628 [Hyaloscypha variabilis F]|uniref:Uncharacterized protein n=1 Tax=Hyaloscypha variabilis (strain UAMH 11265 / GT02V1 / F) TaxID=1149755 RepID=A0A2J6RZA5_HYAVF|nr:hypothetical protein L207DRAFT_508628 [Hyaloscypha variabilis F]
MEQIWELQQPYRGTSPHCWVPDSRLLLLSASRPQTSETILEVSPVILWHATDIMLSEDYQELLAKDLKSFLDTFSNDYPSKKGWCADLYENVYAHYSEMLGRQFLPEAEFRRTLGLRTHLEEIKGDFDFDLDACLSDFIFAHAFDAKKRSTLAGRRLASLTGNRTALVPPMAQAGDVIYRIDRISQELPWDGTFVFRSLSRELADSTTHEMSVPQMEALDEFRQTLQLYSQSQGQGTISEEYQHCILLGQSRIFERGRPGRSERRGVRRLDWSQSQLLVVH